MTLKRDHRDEHPGCKVFWPWLKWCSKYRYASQLVNLALKDIETMDEKDFQRHFEICKQYDDVSKHRSGVRSAYIAHIERWHEDDVEFEKESAQRLRDNFGEKFLGGRTVEEEFEHMWMRKQQSKAVAVLYAYGMFNKRTGKIELDRLSKLR